MSCSSIDIKAYALGEESPRGPAAAHIESCENCREELERLRLTQSALLALPEEEIPQRIAFVSDKIFEPRWYQKIWHSGPVMGFASAALLACAIVVHGFAAQPAKATAVDTAQIEKRIDQEVARRVQSEVSQRVSLELVKATADSRAREAKAAEMLDAAEKKFELQRQSDMAMMQQTADYYRNKMGQLMVASNRSLGGAQ